MFRNPVPVVLNERDEIFRLDAGPGDDDSLVLALAKTLMFKRRGAVELWALLILFCGRR